ncbi:Platelet-activating factor acetylhydrolase [Desmophyllum pertusum]|uniref:1-alkyl-2-acetylglycerophosphocholine esterase n=1 Tax=Desmophyllum pertusum TaxID=174260 RepID=A0A9X0CKK7_9CNID|nr:Platelet-activating factor acetylhydrolase [Desmophyllum pertusum]
MSSWFSFWRVQTKFEECTGLFSVGCTDFMCAEDDSAGVTGKAGSFIRFFYPTERTAALDETKTCFWIPRQEYTSGLVNFMKFPAAWLLGGLFYWTVGSLRIPAVYNAPVYKPVGDTDRSLPCVVFSHGLGGNRLLYSTYCCELASQGCVVACVEHRDESASATYVLKEQEGDEEMTEEWMQYHSLQPSYNEFEFRNSQVHHRANECINARNILEKIHSGEFPRNLLKENSILQTAQAKDKRFRCGVVLDVWMLPLGEEIFNYELDQPLLFVNSQAFHRWKGNMDPLKKLINKKPDTRPIIAIRWTKHMNQCDIPSVLPPYILRWTSLGSKLDPSTAVSLNRQAVWAFISRHLGIGNPPLHEPILDGGEGTPEHIIIGSEMTPQTDDKKIDSVPSSL